MKTILNRRFKKWIPIVAGIIAIAFVVTWTSCKDDLKGKTFIAGGDLVSILDYILDRDPSMEMFLEIAQKVKFDGTYKAYGNLTCFIPTNEAVLEYLNGRSISDLSDDECWTILRYHTINIPPGVDSLTTASFVDGRLPIPNVLAKYLTTRTVAGGVWEVDRRAKIIQKDIRATNGYIQKIDKVLIPPAFTVGEQIMALPNNFSLYKSVMEETGWIDSLNVEYRMRTNADKIQYREEVWFTAFVQSNETFASYGINNRDDLIDALKEARPDIGADDIREPFTMSKEDSLLWNFAAYQVIRSLNYVTDLTRASTLLTSSPNQVMTFKMKKSDILINEFNNAFGAIVEVGAPIDRQSEFTDLSCKNGVLMEVAIEPMRTQYVGPRIRLPSAVYWDVCTQPEWRSHPNYMKGNIDHIDTKLMTEMWAYNAEDEEIDAASINYIYNTNQTDSKWQVVNHDYMRYRVRDFAYLDFRMPLLLDGIYNLWTCIRRDGNPIQVQLRFLILHGPDGKEIQKNELGQIVDEDGNIADRDGNFIDANGNMTGEKLYIQQLRQRDLYFQYSDRVKNMADMINFGVKRYAAVSKANESYAMECGTFEIKSTGRHILRVEVVNQGTRADDSFLDMFQFIPPDQDQYWPRFDRAGMQVWPDTPCEDVFPYELTGCNMGET